MRTIRYFSNILAITAVLFVIRPLAGIESQEPSSVTSLEQGDLADLSNSGSAPLGVSPVPGGPEGRGVKEQGNAAAGLHATRVGIWSSSPLSGPIKDGPIAHFGVVEEGILYRSAQPDEDQVRWLVNQGFRSIVSFRREAGDHTGHMLKDGFKNALWLNVEDEADPNDEQAARFLDFITDSENWPILIHCKVGLGRTGTMAALARYAVDGWSMEDAIKEARLYRGGVDLVPSQMVWLEHWAANHPPACHRPLTSLPS